ncbi:MAG: prolipoprotein diacylglyceryl transferase family protein [Candidatus Peregrinibacteria bacterium]
MFEVLFQYGPFTLRTFNVFLALGFLLGMVFLIRYIRRLKFSASFFSSHFFSLLLIVLLSGRIVYILEHFSQLMAAPFSMITIWDMNFSGFGMMVGGLLGLYIFTRKSKEDFWAWFDPIVLAGLLGLSFIHIGWFFNGSDYGKPTDLPWGIAFDLPTIPFVTPLHPTQLYSAIIAFVIFTYGMKKIRQTHLNGVAGSLALMLYSLSAFGIDFLHATPSSYDRITFIILAILGFIALVHCSHKTYQSSH